MKKGQLRMLEEMKQNPRKRYKAAPLDRELIPILDSLNSIPGVISDESCSGHGIKPAGISFLVLKDYLEPFFDKVKDIQGIVYRIQPYGLAREGKVFYIEMEFKLEVALDLLRWEAK
jgi:hypothetical protein